MKRRKEKILWPSGRLNFDQSDCLPLNFEWYKNDEEAIIIVMPMRFASVTNQFPKFNMNIDFEIKRKAIPKFILK